ncbi:alpha/beta fold hydrolase [Mycobacteroides sp. LB1]|uniref:alpha/beta fold hydrolase n=1 Tax=Mycobacteroides sp. LB1 TaxID=2750814 RepID=UPI00352CB67F
MIDGDTVHYHDVGHGAPVVMNQAFGPLPGTTAWLTYQAILQELAEDYRCILIDYPNFGRSSPLEFHEPVHDLYMRNMMAVVDAVELGSFALLGVSTGGTVALDAAVTYPDRIEKLIIGGCSASTGGDPYLLAPAPTEVGRLFDECVSRPPERDRIERLLRAIVFDSGLITDPLVDAMCAWALREPEHVETWRRSTVVPRSNVAALQSITAPTLLVHGRFDRMVPLEGALMLLGHLPHSDLVILNNCGHWPPFERPRDFVSVVRAFLS